jgi:glutaredoxin-like protein
MAISIRPRVERLVRARFENLVAPVTFLCFTKRQGCPACDEQRALLRALASLSEKLELELRELPAEAAEAARYRVDKTPATVLLGERDYGIRFYGLTGGYAFSALVDAILMISTGCSGLDPDVEEAVRAVRKRLHLEVFVSLRCPGCAGTVRRAHELAFASSKVVADMVDMAEFPALAERYRLNGVPQTVVNGGASPSPAGAISRWLGIRDGGATACRTGAHACAATGSRQGAEAGPEPLWWEPVFAARSWHRDRGVRSSPSHSEGGVRG